MSQEFAPTFTETTIEDELARGEIIVSKDGFNVTGGDLEVMLETRNANAALNDLGAVLGQSDALIAIGNITAKYKDFVGTFTDNIVAPGAGSNSLDVIGMRVFDANTFVYDAPIVTSSPFPEPAKIIDRQFELDPTTLELTNLIALETIFDYDTDAVRDISTKVQVITIPVETSSFNFFTSAGSNAFTVDSNGNFFVITSVNNISKFDSAGAFVLSFVTTGSYTATTGIAVDSADLVYVLSYSAGGSVIEKFSNVGVFDILGTVQDGNNDRSFGLGINSLDEIFALTYTNLPNNSFMTRLNTSLVIQDGPDELFDQGPSTNTMSNSVAFDLDDNVYVIDLGASDFFKINRTNLGIISNTGSSGATNVAAIGDTLLLQTGDQYRAETKDNVTLGTFTQADGFPVVRGNFLYTHTGGIINKYPINFGTSTLEVLTRDSNSNFISRVIQTLSTTIPETILTGSFNMRFAKAIVSNFSSDEYRAFFLIFENFDGITPIVTSSDWTTTGSMVDNNLATFDIEEVGHLATASQTIIDFSTISSRDFSANVQVDVISGTPTHTFTFEGSNDLVTFTPITAGTLNDGVLENIASVAQLFRYVRVTQSTIDIINPFVVTHSMFEVWDNLIVNGLDFSTVRVGGSTAANGAIDQTDPLTFQIADGGEGLQPNQPFPLEASKFLTMNVTALRTGQVIQLHRVTTVTIQRG